VAKPDRPTRNVTLVDVARYAGVSTAVVSYVVNDGPRPVAPATAERVRNAISVLGYRPNSHARALLSGRTGILGLIHPGTSNPFFGEYSDVLYESATRNGVALLNANSAGNADTERQLIESLARRSVDGILVVTSMSQSDIPQLHDPGIPILFIDCPFPIPGHRAIGPNSIAGTRKVVEHLIVEHCHRDIAFIAGAAEPEEREQGWRDALRAHGLPDGQLIRTNYGLDGGYEAARALLARPDRPRAIFVASDLQAYGALHAIHQQQLRIPQDIAIVSFDGNTESAHTWPPLTIVRQPLAAMADAAITDILRTSPPKRNLFDMELIIHQSCGCTPGGNPS
jgi:LacI family transcriptional regulator